MGLLGEPVKTSWTEMASFNIVRKYMKIQNTHYMNMEPLM